MMDDRRELARTKRLKEGRIVFHNRTAVMSCIVRDATENGARVTVGEPYLVPHEFDFALVGGTPRPARKIWIRQNEMGLQYLA